MKKKVNKNLCKGGKFAVLTAYDFLMGQILAEAEIEAVLVGDSLGMVVYGDGDTRNVTLDMMIRHGAAVAKGVKSVDKDNLPMVIVDMPFGSYEDEVMAVSNAVEVIEKTGCDAVKIEGNPGVVRAVVNSGIEVVGHTGLKPQEAERFGVRGGSEEERVGIIEEAVALADAGVLALVLECVPNGLAKEITDRLKVPTIGIGAGGDCDGQVLVSNDILGLSNFRSLKFVREFAGIREGILKGVLDFKDAVSSGDFPLESESFIGN